MAEIIKTIFQFKRATTKRWDELNPILLPGEPGYDLDKGKFKIGNGIDKWKELPFQGEELLSVPTKLDFPNRGSANFIYKAEKEKALYQWNEQTLSYEYLGSAVEVEDIEIISGGDAELLLK